MAKHFWQFFLKKKSQIFGNFLTVKWQFSGGSGSERHQVGQICDFKISVQSQHSKPKATEN